MWQWDPATTSYVEVDGDASQPYVPNLDRTAPDGTSIAFAEGLAAIPFSAVINEVSTGTPSRRASRCPTATPRSTRRRPWRAPSSSPSRPPTSSSTQLAGGTGPAMMEVFDAAGIPTTSIDVVHPNAIFMGADNYTSGFIAGEQAGQRVSALGHCGDVWMRVGENLGEGEAANQRLVGFKDGVQTVCGPIPADRWAGDLRPAVGGAGAHQDDRLADPRTPRPPTSRRPRSTTRGRMASPRRSRRVAARASRSGWAATPSASRRPRLLRRPSRFARLRRLLPGALSGLRRVHRARCPRGQARAAGGAHRPRVPRPRHDRDRLSLTPAPIPDPGRPRPWHLLQLEGVSRTFGNVVALRDVDMHIGASEAVGLIGDNGAGKSTLVKILSGVHPPDRHHPARRRAGVVRQPLDARRSGIEMIYQDLALCDSPDVTANVFPGREPKRRLVGPVRSSTGSGCATRRRCSPSSA